MRDDARRDGQPERLCLPVDLSKEHYGLHGTPEPQTVGKTQSHGCVRLTNWDALTLAGLVQKGTPVLFRE